LLGLTGFGGGTPDIAFDADGNLYGVKSGANAKFISIDKKTGLGTLIGQTGFTSVSGLDIEKIKGSMSLASDVQTIESSIGGIANFDLDAGVINSNRFYIIFGSITGTTPGTPLPGGAIIIPFNWDIFTNIVFNMINTPSFDQFMGNLSATGTAQAQLNTFIPIPGALGLTLTFAYALNRPLNFASNHVIIDIIP